MRITRIEPSDPRNPRKSAAKILRSEEFRNSIRIRERGSNYRLELIPRFHSASPVNDLSMFVDHDILRKSVNHKLFDRRSRVRDLKIIERFLFQILFDIRFRI